MATREGIRAVFAGSQLDGMERFNHAIGELLLTGAAFENAYSLVIAAGDVQCATRFNEPPEKQSFWRCWRSSVVNMLLRDQLIKKPTCDGVKCVRFCQEIDREHQFPLLVPCEFYVDFSPE